MVSKHEIFPVNNANAFNFIYAFITVQFIIFVLTLH